MILNKNSKLKEKRIQLPDNCSTKFFQRVTVLFDVHVSVFLKKTMVSNTKISTEIVQRQSTNKIYATL